MGIQSVGPRVIRAPRGSELSCKGWGQEGALRMLMNNLDPDVAAAWWRLGASLAGTLTVTAGLGGMGGAQPLAVTMNGGVAICIEVDPSRIRRRIDHRYLDVEADDLDGAIDLALAAKADRRP